LDIKQKRILSYALYGFFLGLVLPIISTVYELLQLGVKLSLSSILATHLSQPLMLIIPMAPLLLSASFALIGLQSSRFYETSLQLDEQIKEQAIQIQNEQYFLEALINSTSFAVVRLDIHNRIISCNPAFEELYGYSNTEITGLNLDNLIASEIQKSQGLIWTI